MPSRAKRTTDTGIFAIFRHGTGSTSCTAVTDTLYGYTNLGQLESVTVVKQDDTAPSQSFSGNRYNATGGAINTTLPTTLYSHDADGSVTKIAYANGTETDYDYSQMWNASDGQGVETEKVDVTFSASVNVTTKEVAP